MITSAHNPKIQFVRRLQALPKMRREQHLFVVEGVRLAEEAIRAGWVAQQVFYTEKLDARGRSVVDGFRSQGATIELVSEAVMKAASETEAPQGIVAVISQQVLSLPNQPDFLLILDGLRDPGNLGTILRTAAAARVQAVLLAPGCADAWSPKVLRSAMGAHFHVPIQSFTWPDIRLTIRKPGNDLKVCLSDPAAGVAYTDADFKRPTAFIVGGEAAGACGEASELADMKIHISMPGGSESLNAAIATGILLFEVVRQRTG